MYLPNRRLAVSVFLLALMALLVVAMPSVQADPPLLVVRVPDTLVLPGALNVRIPVYLTNYQNVVAGFEIWIQLGHDGVMEFHEEIDTAGTLISGWEVIDTRHLTGQPFDLKVAAIADNPHSGGSTPGISPQQEDLPLYYLIADVYDLPDTNYNRSVDIIVQRYNLDHFNFSDEDGTAIGLITETIYDSTLLRCAAWDGDNCLSWWEVPVPPYDSLIVDTSTVVHIDTSRVFVDHGSLHVEAPFVCGDIDGSGGIPDISDITYLVSFMFQEGPPPPNAATADIDGSGGPPDIGDLIELVTYMFQDGVEPTCGV